MRKIVKVSVIITVYNAAKYLRECLESVLNQTLKDIEIICVNDGSSDNSLEILQEYAREDERLIVVDQKNQGAGAGRNNGLHIAKGEYLSFLDADDFFDAEMLEDAYRTARVADADVCVFAADLFVQSDHTYKPCTWSFRKQYFPIGEVFNPKDPQYCDNIFRMYNGWAWDKLFKREFVQEHKLEFQNLRTTNDMFFVFVGLAKASRIIAVDKVFAHQRVEVTTSLSRTREKSWDCFYIALLAMQKELKEAKLYDTYKRAFINWALNFSLWQLKTMNGVAKQKAYQLLKKTGFAQLDVAKYPRGYFYSSEEYEQFVRILTGTYVDVMEKI